MPAVRLWSLILEDFEDNDITDYEGDTGQFEVETDHPYEGDYCLAYTGAIPRRIYRPDIDAVWGHRLTARLWWPAAGQDEGASGFMFGCTDSINAYLVWADFMGQLLSLFKLVTGTPTSLDSAAIAVAREVHHAIVIDWTDAGVITINGFGVEVTATDTTYEGGGIGWSAGLTFATLNARMDYATYGALWPNG